MAMSGGVDSSAAAWLLLQEGYEAAGVTMDREYTPEDYVVNAGEYELAWFMNDNGNEIMVDMINNTDGPLAVKDCLVGGISVSA